MDSKVCAYPRCGGTFHRPEKIGGKQWAARQFCSRTCKARAGSAAPPTKACEHCRGRFAKAPNYSRLEWDKRRFCSKPCAALHVWNERRAARGLPAHTVRQARTAKAAVAAPSVISGDTEEAIARFIAERGVTRCPTAAVAPSLSATIGEDDRAALAHYAAAREKKDRLVRAGRGYPVRYA